MDRGERRVILECDNASATISNISWASYGTFGCHWDGHNCGYTSDGDIFPGTCDDVALMTNRSCDLASAAATVESLCLGHATCALDQGPPTFPDGVDPCPGIYKSLFVRAHPHAILAPRNCCWDPGSILCTNLLYNYFLGLR